MLDANAGLLDESHILYMYVCACLHSDTGLHPSKHFLHLYCTPRFLICDISSTYNYFVDFWQTLSPPLHLCSDWIHYCGTKSPPDPPKKQNKTQQKKTSHSKLSLYVACEVRVIGLKTDLTVATQPASTGTTYQRTPLGKGWMNPPPPPQQINGNQWMDCEGEEERKLRWKVG